MRKEVWADILGMLVVTVILYLLSCFISWKWWPGQWFTALRWISGLVWLIFLIIVVAGEDKTETKSSYSSSSSKPKSKSISDLFTEKLKGLR